MQYYRTSHAWKYARDVLFVSVCDQCLFLYFSRSLLRASFLFFLLELLVPVAADSDELRFGDAPMLLLVPSDPAELRSYVF